MLTPDLSSPALGSVARRYPARTTAAIRSDRRSGSSNRRGVLVVENDYGWAKNKFSGGRTKSTDPATRFSCVVDFSQHSIPIKPAIRSSSEYVVMETHSITSNLCIDFVAD
jgi:hypothetical protein